MDAMLRLETALALDEKITCERRKWAILFEAVVSCVCADFFFGTKCRNLRYKFVGTFFVFAAISQLF